MLPQPYTSMDTHRVTLGCFVLSALELLGVLDEVVSEKDRKDWIEWIYAQQRTGFVPATTANGKRTLPHPVEGIYGFAGGPFSGRPYFGEGEKAVAACEYNVYDSSHLTMTYVAIMTLVLLGDDLSRVDKESILQSMRRLQLPSGCFVPCVTDYQPDMRFVFCAAAVSHALNDWSGVDREAMLSYIRSCQGYDFGIAQCPHQESHGGSMFCAIAALGLLGGEALHDQKTILEQQQQQQQLGLDQAPLEAQLSRVGLLDKEATIKWALMRQTTGFQGRVNKPTDTCYSFWIGASLKTLGAFEHVDYDLNRGFLFETQHPAFGGFGKWVDTYPGKFLRVEHNVMHSYMGVAAMALMGEPGLQPLDPLLNISCRTRERLERETVFWKKE
ncbi:Geranylgeranyl transferase type-1 subunit beta [Actinomortierella ambigua]|uniref:Geranylgeranyl transferase type-1 subunit beta n=1 Tax=Actinomortierella ambigua TaxID=1343610 RepID=A0A9P6QKC2_9FUNG|nr:Geranylgeranyl transferase type-1 subunit beta [Actinomortierella ambigua]